MGNKPSPCPRAPDRTADMNVLMDKLKPMILTLTAYKEDAIRITGDFDRVFKDLENIEKDITKLKGEKETEKSVLTAKRNGLRNTFADRKIELDRLSKDLKERKDANEAKNKLLRDYKKSIAITSKTNNDLNKAIIVSTEQYHDALKSENKILDNHSKETVDSYSTDNSRNFYLFETKDILTTMNDYFSMIYYFLLIIFAYFIYYKPIPMYSKIILLIILFLFPFFITELQDNLRFVYKYVKIDLLKI
uniref:Uncharacterized protein n=1 Tax=viral metagenome TaxID=1070528 RepID=A0A6C0JHF3_9ZZZZ